MSTETSPIRGVFTTDPIHSSVGFAVKYMGVSTFRASFDRLSAKLAGGRDGVELIGAADVESVSIHAPEQFRAHVLGEDSSPPTPTRRSRSRPATSSSARMAPRPSAVR
jgi:polyisoprenoid-binding protein YceI